MIFNFVFFSTHQSKQSHQLPPPPCGLMERPRSPAGGHFRSKSIGAINETPQSAAMQSHGSPAPHHLKQFGINLMLINKQQTENHYATSEMGELEQPPIFLNSPSPRSSNPIVSPSMYGHSRGVQQHHQHHGDSCSKGIEIANGEVAEREKIKYAKSSSACACQQLFCPPPPKKKNNWTHHLSLLACPLIFCLSFCFILDTATIPLVCESNHISDKQFLHLMKEKLKKSRRQEIEIKELQRKLNEMEHR